MVEPIKKEGEEKVEKKEEKKETVASQKIELDAEQYNQLLDRLAELEAGATMRRSRGASGDDEILDVDTLAAEGRETGRRKVPEKEAEEVDWDNLSNRELVEKIVGLVNEQGGARVQKLEVAVETQRVLREIDKAEKDHEDFWEHEEEVRKISIANPTLSIEEAYQLAKVRKARVKPAKKEGEEEVITTRTERLLKLPARQPLGEKPGRVAAGATRVTAATNVTTKQAAQEAWDEVVGKGKTEV